ncbi:MAG: structural protein [Magnetospirillum sp.]|nr:MAG: structural protein [Magnetospirillum sp.]
MTKDCVVPRGIRMNNPGNIKEAPGDKTQWQGERATDDDPVFEEFVSPEAGIRALTRILLGYQHRHGLNTVAGIINRWAPGCENDTGAYIAHVATRLGVRPDQNIDVTVPDVMADLVEAIIRHENGRQPYTREVILAGVDLGLARA